MYRRCIVFVTSICKYPHHTVLQSTQPYPIALPHILLAIFPSSIPPDKIMKLSNLVISSCLAVSWSELKLGWLCRGQFRSAGQWWAWLNLHRRHDISKHLYRYNFITTEHMSASYWSRMISGNETRLDNDGPDSTFTGDMSSQNTYTGTTSSLLKIFVHLTDLGGFLGMRLGVMIPLQIFSWWVLHCFFFLFFMWSLGSGLPMELCSFPHHMLNRCSRTWRKKTLNSYWLQIVFSKMTW